MQAMLKSAQMVRKGSIVKIMAENGSLLVTTIGLSEDNGGQGDIIKVKNLTSNKIVYAKVIDQALVRVDF
jgi:flagella basal body P-ring formation protein FlgA